MFKFLFAMVIPVMIFAYTMSFTRWVGSRAGATAQVSAGTLGILSLVVSAAVLWKLLT
ncbi:hypothetical protein Alches_13620 [Alicyclobacillus hesperidum subsp. aegles]|uniref:hypothetical protein n=1 Tax=Alicyclobacillus hesperidum TaxID=89784 RepID=UPI00222A11D5|nr:hypothetical protein [Alicyclobacillus hesperidum]GLG01323.1 hypothetical protein Alches_13620 [Alicyclobacillus hesperidum subsp. aegles]